MGFYQDAEITEGMSVEQLKQQLFQARKKLILRQNASDPEKREIAERELAAINVIEDIYKAGGDGFAYAQLLTQTVAFAVDNNSFPGDFKKALVDVIAYRNGDLAEQIADFLGAHRQEELRDQWIFLAAEYGNAACFGLCGDLLCKSRPEKAVVWYQKAQAANAVSASNLYNWGWIYYREKNYPAALPILEAASAQGYGDAAVLLGLIYENGGCGIETDLNRAVRYYQEALRRGVGTAQGDLNRARDKLYAQTGINDVARNAPNDYSGPVLVFKKVNQQVPADQAETTAKGTAAQAERLYEADRTEKNSFIPQNADGIRNNSNTADNHMVSVLETVIAVAVAALILLISVIAALVSSNTNKKHIEAVQITAEESTESSVGDDYVVQGESVTPVPELEPEMEAFLGTYSGYCYSRAGKNNMVITVYRKASGVEADIQYSLISGEDASNDGEFTASVSYSEGTYTLTGKEWVVEPDSVFGEDLPTVSGQIENNLFYGNIGNSTFAASMDDYAGDAVIAFLTGLDPVKSDEQIHVVDNKPGTVNTGEQYYHYIFSDRPYSEIVYRLGGRYDTLTALWAVCYDDRDDAGDNAFCIYADDELVYTSDVITSGSLPEEISVDIADCDLLRILFTEGTGSAELTNIRLTGSASAQNSEIVQESATVGTWLTDLEYLTQSGVTIKSSEIGEANTGDTYSHYLYGEENSYIEYYLRGKYNHLEGLWTVCYNNRDTDDLSCFEIYADDELVYTSPVLTGGDMPETVDVDIGYCERLRIVFTQGDGTAEFGNIYLTSMDSETSAEPAS